MVSRTMRYRVWVGAMCLVAGLGALRGVRAKALGPGTTLTDSEILLQMEERAERAQPRDRCYLYAEVLAGWTEVEGHQIASGEEEQARVTRKKMDELAGKVHSAAAGDAKKLKNAELTLEHATRRVSDMVHTVSAEEQAAMQATLQHMSSVHSELLAMVFAH